MSKRIGWLSVCVLLVMMTASCAGAGTAEPSRTSTSTLPQQTETASAVRADEADFAAPQTREDGVYAQPEERQDADAGVQNDAKTTQSGKNGPLFQRYVRDLVEDGEYTVSMRQSGITMVTAISGKNSAVDSDMAGLLHITLIHRDDQYYMLMHTTRKYAEMTEEEYAKQVSSMESATLELKNIRLLESGEQTIAGTRYKTETYDEGGRGTVTYFFTDSGLARAQVVRDGKTTDVESFTVRDTAQADLFEIPDGFTRVEDPAQLMT